MLLSPSAYASLPPPGDADQARLGFERWREAAHEIEDPSLAAFMRDLAADAAGNRLLASLFGNSPFLTQCCLREPDLLMRLVQQGPEATFADVEDRLNRHLAATPSLPALMQALRIAKRRVALLVAIADIAGWWELERVTGALSRFADTALAAATRHLLAAAQRQGEFAAADPEAPEQASGFIVLGMGKLGGRELNYSSDVDLILLYDADKAPYAGKLGIGRFFARLAQELVRLIQERTADGYVFRGDLRLRPDPGSTPPALSVMAALTYYEGAGQNWERAALIKARPVAGDIAAGTRFLAELRPFLWRKHQDFAALPDIHTIKRQINPPRGGTRIAVAGHNIKIGRGGIREIEFFAQTQQLIWGGRFPALRAPETCAALEALARTGRISAETAAELQAAYRFLRRVEHRLQMIDDAQTHTLPADDAGLARFAIFMGFASVQAFAAELLRHLGTVESRYAALFEEAPSLAAPGNLVFTGTEDDPDTLKTLAGLGFADPAAVAGLVRGWHHGRHRATRSQRARELLTELVPSLLRAFGASANPDLALVRFDQFLARLPAGVQLFSLLYKNAGLLHLIAEIMAAGPRLADLLARRPGLLDGVLSEGFFDPPPPRAELAAELDQLLAGARDYEETLYLARRWVGDRKFQVGAQLLRAKLDGEAAGAVFADIAEAAIAGLLPRVAAEFARLHGEVSGGGMVVLGLGKLGSREMTVTSDLDLILVYDAPESVESSDGQRPLAVSTYYARLSQRLINALTASTADGNLYDVDMRLRPSGSKGPVASSLAAFRRYHRELAWTWEQMALTRARPVAGQAALAQAVMAEVEEVLVRPRNRRRLAGEVAQMRRRMEEQQRNPSFWEVKHRRGGLIDIEFIAQYLQLREAARRKQVLRQNTGAALAALTAAGALDARVADELCAALWLWRDVQGLIKLTVEEPFDEAQATPALKALLARGAGAVDFAALKADMEAAASRTLGHYRAIIETEANPEEHPP
ncbi:MAG: bifunctional [glutamine synthetase] adenylyltransferase/[glutamine synthetase]-adenylyl-L-tyrosine phosphorylase [Stellaceae bacterium]